MSKFVKELITEEIKVRYDGVNSACVVDITGMSVQKTEDLRKKLHSHSARLQVVKNAIARRAFKGSELEPLGAALEGPSAIITTSDSIIAVAKALVAAAVEFPKLKLKQAIIEGDAGLVTIEQASKMRGRREMLGEIAAASVSPGRKLAGCIGGPAGRIAGCIKTIADKTEVAAEAA